MLIFYKYIDYKFPGSKFVLTLRDLDSWLDSMAYAAEIFPVVSRDEDIKIMRRMTIYEAVGFDRTYNHALPQSWPPGQLNRS